MFPGLIAVCFLSSLHLVSGYKKFISWAFHKSFLSFGSGVSLSYVFISLLPSIAKEDALLKSKLGHIPFMDKYAYALVLLGILFYSFIDRKKFSKDFSWLPNTGYFFFNFLLGSILTDTNDPEIQPLVLFTIAIGMHNFISDYFLKTFKKPHLAWALVFMLFAGYITSSLINIPDFIMAIAVAFAAGGVILHVFLVENPAESIKHYFIFVLGALIYSSILLTIGTRG